MDVPRLFQIKVTQVQMVKDRGFVHMDEPWIPVEETISQFGLEDFVTTYSFDDNHDRLSFKRSNLSAFYQPKNVDDPYRRLYVYYNKYDPDVKNIGKEEIENFIGVVIDANVTDAIIIADKPLTPQAKDLLMRAGTVSIQVFEDKELTFNVTLHDFVPKHELLDEKEQRKMICRNHITINQLPLIRVDDPVVKYYGWKVGGVVRIKRLIYEMSIPVSVMTYYRLIVPANIK